MSRLAGVLGGVVQQVADHLREPHRVAAHTECADPRLRSATAGASDRAAAARFPPPTAMTSASFTGSLSNTILPRAMRDTSSRSSTRRIMCLSCRSITPRDQTILGSVVSPCMSMCEALRSGDNGLRSSCDSIARNSSRLTTASFSEVSARMRSRTSVSSDWLVRDSSSLACCRRALISSSSRVFSVCSAKFASSSWRLDSASWRFTRLQRASLAVELDEHRHLAAQDLRHHRDVDVVDGAGLVALQPVELGDVHAGHEDDGRAFETRVVVNEGRGLEAVHARHLHVEQHHREVLLHQRFERLEAGIHRHQVVAQRFEDGPVREQACRLIVDQQDVGRVVAVRNGRRIVHRLQPHAHQRQ